MTVGVRERFESQFTVSPTGCWLWAAFLHVSGYGRIKVNGKYQYAHRVAYELLVGPIPSGLQLDHLCRNRACVNPQHLEPVTQRVNTLRSPVHVAALNALKTECKRGHPFTPENTAMVNTGRGRRGRRCLTCRSLKSRRSS